MKNHEIHNAIQNFSQLLEKSVKKRVQYTTKFCSLCIKTKNECNHSKIAILFSGGIDCSILAVLSDKYVPKTDTIDLINVAFENKNPNNSWDVPDRISAKLSLKNLEELCPDRYV